MTWWDHETGSVWSQPLGEAIVGELKGSTIELLPSTLTQWDAWVAAHPETLAIDTFGFPMVVGLDDIAIVVEIGSKTTAYPYADVAGLGVVNDVVGGAEVAVVVDPGDPDRWAVFSRRVEGGVVELAVVDGGLVDVATGTRFDPSLGLAREGPLEGQDLALLPALTVFPKDFETFWPDGRIWRP